MYGGYGYSGGTTPMWYVPQSTKEKEAFEEAQLEIKNFLVVSKEGVNTTRIVNFLGDVGVTIPHAKFGLTFNEFLFHCQNFIQVRMFLPRVYVSRAKFIFLNPNAVDAETKHLLTLVQHQMTEKKRTGQPRPTLRNTHVVQPDLLLDAPPPFVRTGPPTVPSSSRGPGGPLRPISTNYQRGSFATRTTSAPSPLFARALAQVSSPFVPHAFSGSSAPRTPGPSSSVRPQVPPVAGPAFVGFGAIPRAQLKLPTVFTDMHPRSVTTGQVLPTPRLVLCGGGIDPIDNREPLTPQIATPKPTAALPTPSPIVHAPQAQNVSQDPQPSIQKAATLTQHSAATPVPVGYVNPLQACPSEFSLSGIEKYMADESVGKRESLLSLTVTGFKEGDPELFYVRLRDVGRAVIRIENMMKTFYEYKPQMQPKVTRNAVLVNGIYGGLDRETGAWRRVQVMKVKDDVAGDKPLTVFLIDHGKILDLSIDDLRYLKEFYSGVMRHGYFASWAYLPHEPKMLGQPAHFFMRMNTGKSFLCYLRNMEMREHGPHLMLRFVLNLDKAI